MYRQGGSYHSSNGDQLGSAGRRRQSFRCTAREGATTAQMETNWAVQGGGGRVSGEQPGREQPQLKQRPTGQGREEEAEPGREQPQLKRRPTGQGREEEADSQVYSQGGSHHSSNGDQLGRAGRRRQSFRCTAREGATTAKRETNWAGQGGGGRVSGVQPGREPPQLKRRPTGQCREEEAEFQAYSQEEPPRTAQTETNWAGQGGGGRVSGVQPGREQPQLKRRPTGQGREEEADSQAYSQGGSHHSSNGDQLGRAGRRRQSIRFTAREGATTAQTETNWAGQGGGGRVSGVQPGRDPPQLKRRPTGQCREEEADSQVYHQGGSHHSSNGDQLGRAGRRRQSLGVPPGREPPQLKWRPTGQGREEEAEFQVYRQGGSHHRQLTQQGEEAKEYTSP